MPIDIVGGLITYLSNYLTQQAGHAVSVWDGEVPRYDAAGNAVAPSNTTGSWPAIKVFMGGSFKRKHTAGANAYDDQGPMKIEVWSVGRKQTQDLMTVIETLFEMQPSDMSQVSLGGSTSNPNYIISMTMDTWINEQEEGERTATSQFLYKGTMIFDTDLHGTVDTVS